MRKGAFDSWGSDDSEKCCMGACLSDSSKEGSHFSEQIRKKVDSGVRSPITIFRNVKIFHINYLKESITQVSLTGSDLPRFLASHISPGYPMGTKQK